jgi:hypothetical protein
VSEDDVVKAFLGDPAARKKFEDAVKKRDASGKATDLSLFNLGDVAEAVQAAGGAVAAAGLGGQFINSRAPVVATAQDRAQSAQRSASGRNPTLNSTGQAFFTGISTEVPTYEATSNQFGIVAYNLKPEQIANLKARNNDVGAGYPTGKGTAYRIIFTEADAKAMLSYAAGGPSPDGKGTGPTGGHIVELHSDEWVLPAHARKRIGDPTLWALTGGDRRKKRSGFNTGGPGGLAVDLPPVIPPPIPGVGTGPLPGPAPAAPAAGPTVPHLPGPTATGFTETLPVTSDPAAMGAPPAGGGVIPGQNPAANAGNNFLNAWFPWLPTVQGVMSGDPAAVANFGLGDPSVDPLSHLAQAGGNFLTNLGSTLLGGVMGFFGLDPSLYTNALSQVVGFYGNKFGPMLSGSDQYVDPYTQAVFDQSTGAYTDYPGTVTLSDGTVINTGTSLPDLNPANALASTANIGKPFEGSGVIPAATAADQAKIDASRAPNASVIPDANIVNYIRQQAAKFGLTLGDEGKEGGNPYRTWESSSLHTVGYAGDIMGTPEQRRAFLEAWHADPILKDATRMIIDDNNQDFEMYAGGAPSFDYARGAHGDHIHLGLEGVPGYRDPATGMILQRDIGGGNTVVASNAGSQNTGWLPGAQGGGSQRTDRAPIGSFMQTGGTYGGNSGSPSDSSAGDGGMPPLLLPGSPAPAGSPPPLPAPRGTVPTDPNNPLYKLYPHLRPGGGGNGAGINLAIARQHQQQQGRQGRPKAPPANYAGGNPQIWDAVYQAFLEAGFNPAEWGATVQLLNGESGWRPTVANPSSGAFGLFQFLGATQKAYLPDKNPDPYIQGKAGMKYIKDRYGSPAEAWEFWQNQSPHWYDRGGMLRRGVSVNVNQTGEDEVVLKRSDAQKAKKRIEEARQMQPGRGPASGGAALPPGAIPPTTKRPGPPLTPDVDIPRALAPTPGISGPAMPAEPKQVAGAAPASNDYVLPALAKGISSGAATLGSLASTAISAAAAGGSMGASAAAGGAGAGQAGQLVSGLFQQGGKIATGFANVVSAALTGLTKTGTTENPYGVTLRNNRQPPPLAQDNRRVHNGDNNFASMDEWRRQSQIQDAQDMQASMTRMKV